MHFSKMIGWSSYKFWRPGGVEMSTVDTVNNQEACVCRQLSWQRGLFPQLHLSDMHFRGSFQPLLCWLAAYLELRGGLGELSKLVPGNLFLLQRSLALANSEIVGLASFGCFHFHFPPALSIATFCNIVLCCHSCPDFYLVLFQVEHA